MHSYILYYGRLSTSEMRRVLRDFNILVEEWQILEHVDKMVNLDINNLILKDMLNLSDNFIGKNIANNKLTKDFLLISLIKINEVDISIENSSLIMSFNEDKIFDEVNEIISILNAELMSRIPSSVFFDNVKLIRSANDSKSKK